MLIKVVYKEEDELPEMTKEERCALKEKLLKTAEAFSRRIGAEVSFRGTYTDDEQPNSYCEWTVSGFGLEVPGAVRVVRDIIEQAVGERPSIEHVYAPKRII